MNDWKTPSYDELKQRLAAAEAELKSIRNGCGEAVEGERGGLPLRLSEVEAREAHLKQILLAIRNVNQLIVAEDDPIRLIARACENLTETMGYHSAWIALSGGEVARKLGLSQSDTVAAVASAGFGDEFDSLRKGLQCGELPACMACAMASSEAVVVDNPETSCPGCPLSSQYGGRSGLARRLEFNGVIYGILTVSVPAAYATDTEEQDLFNEVAGDLAFALHKILEARKLEEQRQYLELVIEGSGVGTLEWNVQTNETIFNEQWAGMLGYTLEELTPYDYSTWERLVHPDDIERAQNALAECVEERTANFNSEFRMRHKEGRWIWILDRGRVMTRDDAGRPLAMFGTHTDITELKEAEQAQKQLRLDLGEAHSFLESVLDQSPFPMWIGDASGTLIRTNRALRETLNLTDEQLVGIYNPLQDPNVVREGLTETVQAVIEEHKPARFTMLWRPMEFGGDGYQSGEDRYVDLAMYPIIRDGRLQNIVTQWQDITERLKSQQALEHTSAILQTAMDNSHAGIAIADAPDGSLRYVNKAGLLIRGKEDTEVVAGVDVSKYVESWQICYFDGTPYQPEDVPLARAILKGETCSEEFMIRRQKEDDVIVWANAAPVRNARGEIVAGVVVFLDITERKQMERHNKVLVDIIKRSQDFIGVANPKSEAFFINPAGQVMVGLENDEMVAQTKIRDYFLPEDFPFVENTILPTLRKDGRWAGEFRFRHFKTGEPIPVLYELFLTEDPETGANTNIATITRDITDLKKTEEALRDSERRLSLATKSAGIGIWVWDIITDEMTWDERIFEMYGIADIPDQYGLEFWQNCIHPEDMELAAEACMAAMRGEKEYDIEFRVRWPDGTVRWMQADGLVIRDESGKPVRMLGTNYDITERKNLELNLIEAKDKAEESDRLKSAFLANMSHEIRTPMNGILGFLELMRLPTLSPEQRENYLDVVERSGERLLDTINDIIELSKIEAGEIALHRVAVDLTGVLDYFQQFYEHQARQKGLEYRVLNDLPPNQRLISIDRHKLDSVLGNLIRNAFKFTEQGEIEVRCWRESANIHFTVRDTGIGIPSDRLKAIFERFVQADLTTTSPHEGSGLGLCIAKSYAEALGGSIEVDSTPGAGSVFSFILPAGPFRKAIPGKDTAQGSPVDSLIKDKCVLVVEDDENSFQYMQILLAGADLNVVSARNGSEAVQICQDNPDIDLVFMDIKLPLLDGYEATRKIRQFNPDVPIIAQTAFALPGDEIKAIDAGCNGYLKKPVKASEVIACLREYLY